MQKHYLLPVSLLLILLISINMATCQDQGSGDPSGDDTNCDAPGESLTMEGECQPTCNAGYTWCDVGQQCEVNSNGTGFICTCSPGFYKDSETQSCKVGRYFGGILYFDASSTRSLVRSLSESSAPSIIEGIYSDSTYYYSSTVLTCTENECSYQLVYKNAEGVNTTYIKDIFVDKTNNCTESFTKDFDCNTTRDTGFSQKVMCTSGTFNNTCDDNTAACKVSNTGRFFCDCISENYVLPYSDATSCTEIKCSRDEDCSGGGIHGSCRISDENYAENFCECKWGFTGNTCEDPWWFVFTVLTGAFGVIAIVILAACICMSTKKVPAKSGVQKDDLDLKNPFVDFQPGVRAKASTNLYSSVTDSISSPTTHGHSNPAFNNNAFDENDKPTPYAAAAQGNDYF